MAVNEHLLKLNSDGGSLDMRFQKDYKPRTGGSALRLSASGHCGRKLAYANLVPVTEELSPRSLSIFMLGDVLHDVERNLIGSVAELHSQEKRLEFKVDDTLSVWGHCDGILELASGPALLDVKTASDRSFSDMLRTGVSYEYRCQLNAYMEAAGLTDAYLWVYNKNTSERMVLPVEHDARIVEEVKTRFRRAASATLETLPPRDFDAKEQISRGRPTGVEYLDWHCAYCPFVARCWGEEGFNPVTDKGKTRWLREPTLQEFDI